jgi:hypothetical protein
MHGAKTKRCSIEGCTNIVVKGGVCVTHGAKVVKETMQLRGVCQRASQVVQGGVCYRHGNKIQQFAYVKE